MNAIRTVAVMAVAGLVPGIGHAQDALKLGDVHIMQEPSPAHYQPDSTDYDLADRGKTFDIMCTVGVDGHMRDCVAQPNNMFDQNFVRIGVDNARGFVVGARARDGSPTIGRTLSLTCKFNRTDGDGAQASADAPHDTPATDVSAGISSDVAQN